MKTNEQYLRELIKDNDEAIEFLDALMEEKNDRIYELKEACEANDSEISELKEELTGYLSVNLGLDTLQYKLERGNLHIQSQLEQFIRSANTIPNAEPMFT